MKKIFCILILLATVINIKAEDFTGDISFLKHDSKIAITFNYDGIKIGGKPARQFIMITYNKKRDESFIESNFTSFAEYEAYWKDSVMPRLEKIFIDNFKARQAQLKKVNSVQIVDEKDCQFLIKITLKHVDTDGEIDAVAAIMKKANDGYDEPCAYIELNGNGEHRKWLEDKMQKAFKNMSKDLCTEIDKHMTE
ncbi:MAG: hypothetical protein LKG25_06205 [Prevotella sp.]|jgi:hypothetical protein|nr:hypothetical protein [Prevotella sp.]MCI1282172.1 hypothetical protein [Prevotella sp.]